MEKLNPDRIYDCIICFYHNIESFDNSVYFLSLSPKSWADLYDDTYYYDNRSIDACYLRSRLGYNAGLKDYCFNGFAFRDLLMKHFYTRELYYGPEFVQMLSKYLMNENIIKDYFDNSRYYCFTYKLKIKDVLFEKMTSLQTRKKPIIL